MSITINIAKDYTTTPGGRYKKEGKYSGEDFRETVLLPKYIEAIKNKDKLIVELDGCYGFAPSFLDEAFGGLSRKLNNKHILDNIEIVCNDEPELIEKIAGYIKEDRK